jgi:hypothetical protein
MSNTTTRQDIPVDPEDVLEMIEFRRHISAIHVAFSFGHGKP